MRIHIGVKAVLEKRGCTQTWVVKRMNDIDPSLNMTRNKLSSIVCGSRKMSGDEMLAFCEATETSPDYFCRVAATQDSA